MDNDIHLLYQEITNKTTFVYPQENVKTLKINKTGKFGCCSIKKKKFYESLAWKKRGHWLQNVNMSSYWTNNSSCTSYKHTINKDSFWSQQLYTPTVVKSFNTHVTNNPRRSPPSCSTTVTLWTGRTDRRTHVGCNSAVFPQFGMHHSFWATVMGRFRYLYKLLWLAEAILYGKNN